MDGQTTAKVKQVLGALSPLSSPFHRKSYLLLGPTLNESKQLKTLPVNTTVVASFRLISFLLSACFVALAGLCSHSCVRPFILFYC